MANQRARFLPKAAVALLAGGLLTGCAGYPYDSYYYAPGYAPNYAYGGYYGGYYPYDYGGYGWYGPAALIAPTVVAGVGFGCCFDGGFHHGHFHHGFDGGFHHGFDGGFHHGFDGGFHHGFDGGFHGGFARGGPNQGFGYSWGGPSHFSGFHAGPGAVRSGSFSFGGFHR